MDYIEEYLDGHRYFCYWRQEDNLKYGNQIRVHTRGEVVNLLNEHNGIDNCGLSITTFVKGMPKLLFLPFDFDSDNLKTAFIEASRLYNYFIESGYRAMLNFSGGKGFHVLIPTEAKTYTKNQINEIRKIFKRLLNLTTLDEQIFKDIRRIIRIPGTYHINGNLCYTIAQNDSGKKLNLNNFVKMKQEDFSIEDFKKHDYNNGHIYHPYPCVEKLSKEEEPRQFIRFAWVIEQLQKNKTEEEMLQFAKEYWIDYNPDYTIYQIRFISKGNYSHPSCDTLQSLGFCTKEKCPYYGEWKGIRYGKQKSTTPKN
jgi:hypothetical protein